MSEKEFGCFLCSGKAATRDGVCDVCGQAIDVESDLLQATFGDYRPVRVIGRGFNGWTLEVQDDLQSFAMKVIPGHRIPSDVLPAHEAHALASCSPHRNIARFYRQLTDVASIHSSRVEVRCLVFELIVNARSLAEIIADNSLQLAKTDILAILVGIASGLARMHKCGFWHNDLHDDNVLIRVIGSDENYPEKYEPKLIDFGSTRPIIAGTPEPGTRLDYSYLAKHIYGLVQRFEYGNQRGLTPSDRGFASRLRRLAQRLGDHDVSRRQLTPSAVAQEVRTALDECATGHTFPSFEEMKKQSHVSFAEPLANTNALNLTHQDVALLFRDSLQWQDRIAKSEPVFVVGPRGCGKTMLLRYLSVVSCARPRPGEDVREAVAQRLAKDTPHIGFLVSVGQLRTPFIRSGFKKLVEANSALAEDFCREFLNTAFAFEVVRTFLWLDTEKLVTLTEDDKQLLAAAVENLLDEPPSGRIGALHQIAEKLDRRVISLSNLGNSSTYTPTSMCRDDVLHVLAQAIRRTTSCESKEIWFLLDDYSVTVLPALAQRAYNPVLFRLSSEVRVKASSEGEGPSLTDSLERNYKEGREITKVNLGEVYFQADEDQGREFFERILEARFLATKKGSLQQLQALLGEHEHSTSFGDYIRNLSRPGDARFYGFGLLCCLCSGDVSFIIELLHTLTGGSWDKSTKRLTPKKQDSVIKRFAQRQLQDLHSTSQHGDRLHEFAKGLGNLIKDYLLKTKDGADPDERLRIEIEGDGHLSEEAQVVHDALLRHSVIIAGGVGKSRKGLPARRFFFRRLFAPCFPFSPARKGSIAITVAKYQEWLLNPKKIRAPAEPEPEPEPTPDPLVDPTPLLSYGSNKCANRKA